MKSIFTILLAALMGAALAWSVTAASSSSGSWRLVYAHEGGGKAVEGSKDALLSAIRAGKPVRVYFGMGRVEHTVDAGFITILQDEVFAQIRPITGQKPDVDPARITLRDSTWQTVLATNGDRALRWFVQD